MNVKNKNLHSNIVLTGFMATGKTTVGKLLADQLGYEFVDTDQMIENRCGQTIATIFREKGETAFRILESEVARHLGSREHLVIATGGGMMVNPENVAELQKKGRIYCLVAKPDVILARVSRDRDTQRPLLQTPDPMGRIRRLMAERKSVYENFVQLDTSNHSPEDVAALLLAYYKEIV